MSKNERGFISFNFLVNKYFYFILAILGISFEEFDKCIKYVYFNATIYFKSFPDDKYNIFM